MCKRDADSQRCDLDELAEQLDPLGQRLALQDLCGHPVLHLAAALQNQLQVQGAPARLLPVKHITHKLHLQDTPTKKKTNGAVNHEFAGETYGRTEKR